MRTLIRNGLIYDGTGGDAFTGDILIENQRILAVGEKLDGCRCEIIDASGLVVVPGFIDSHRHADFSIFNQDEFGLSELSQGITTMLVGLCGMSAAPFASGKSEEWYSFIEPCLGKAMNVKPGTMASYLDSLSHQSIPVNVGAMVGLGSVKTAVKGFSSLPWTDQELEKAMEYLCEAVEAGVFGISAGIMYTPECYSTKADYIRMLSHLGTNQIPFVVHMRNEGDSLLDAVSEAIGIASKAGLPLNISHFKVFGKRNWNRTIKKAIGLIDAARAVGQDIRIDFYPYTGGATTLMTLVPPACLKDTVEETIAYLNTAEGLERLRIEIGKFQSDWDSMVEAIGWDRILLSSVSMDVDKKYQGKNFVSIAAEMGVDSAEACVRILTTENGKAGIIVMSMSQEDVDTVAALPYSSVISDALYGAPEFPHPRLNGTFIRVLADYAVNRNVLSFQDAIHKMTGSPADFYKIENRGYIRQEYYADICILDMKKLHDTADFINPCSLSKGVEKVLVNGKIVFENGNRTDVASGLVLRRKR